MDWNQQLLVRPDAFAKGSNDRTNMTSDLKLLIEAILSCSVLILSVFIIFVILFILNVKVSSVDGIDFNWPLICDKKNSKIIKQNIIEFFYQKSITQDRQIAPKTFFYKKDIIRYGGNGIEVSSSNILYELSQLLKIGIVLAYLSSNYIYRFTEITIMESIEAFIEHDSESVEIQNNSIGIIERLKWQFDEFVKTVTIEHNAELYELTNQAYIMINDIRKIFKKRRRLDPEIIERINDLKSLCQGIRRHIPRDIEVFYDLM